VPRLIDPLYIAVEIENLSGRCQPTLHEQIECLVIFAVLRSSFSPLGPSYCADGNRFIDFENPDNMINGYQTSFISGDIFLGGF
jgi:hypothetical protein